MRGSFSSNVRTGMKSLRRWENNKWASADLHSAPAVHGFFFCWFFFIPHWKRWKQHQQTDLRSLSQFTEQNKHKRKYCCGWLLFVSKWVLRKKTIQTKKQNKTMLCEDEKRAAEFILEQRVTHVTRVWCKHSTWSKTLKKKDDRCSPVSCSTLPPEFLMHVDGTIEDGRSHRDTTHWLAFSSLEVGFHTLPHQLKVPWVLLEPGDSIFGRVGGTRRWAVIGVWVQCLNPPSPTSQLYNWLLNCSHGHNFMAIFLKIRPNQSRWAFESIGRVSLPT